MPAKIALNGNGTIGKRGADAVAVQDDMRLAGVAKTKPDFEAKLAVRKGYAVYAANKDALAKFERAGVKAAGILDELVQEADLVVDCTPEESGYKPVYERAGVKAIWQGGEEHALTNLSFNAAANYAECLGAPFVRVPSCNTTGLIRTLYPLDAHVGVEKVLAVMVRRATDPGDSKKGPINAIEPELEMPSHHGPDVQSVLPDLDIHTIAVKVPTTIMHLHALAVDLKKSAGAIFVPTAGDVAGLADPPAFAFQPLNPVRGPLDDAHERMDLPLARDCAADESTKHDLRARSFVRRVIRFGEQRLECLVELLLLQAGRFSLPALDGSRREKFVEQDGHRMRQVENRVVRGCRNRRQ